jgi:EAL domain-containing protein (putative c-di-GMP-specific phosphodiesterase class I)/GGDEF domain-containing protein
MMESGPSLPAPRAAAARAAPAPRELDAGAFALAVERCCAALQPADRAAPQAGWPGDAAPAAAGFALLMVRLHRSDQRRSLLATGVAGHLMPVARSRLLEVLREHDRFTVLGPDELLVLLPTVAVEGVARLAINRIVRALRLRVARGKDAIELRPAIGCALAPRHGLLADQLARAAHAACEAAREELDAFEFAQAVQADREHATLLPALRAAIDGNELVVHYQPQFNLRTRLWEGMEALVRWPRGALLPPVSPQMIAELAENNGLMEPLTRFVLDTALREAAEMARAGIMLGVAVNLSPSSLSDRGLPQRVAQALDLWGVPPARLTLEVTETSILREADVAIQVMRELKEVGVRLSIDDFGTGHSSLARLREMPLDELKIDRLFVASMTRSRSDLQIVRAVLNLAHNFDLATVAEGVEDDETVQALAQLGCDACQGFHFARPMNAAQLHQWWPQRLPHVAPDP